LAIELQSSRSIACLHVSTADWGDGDVAPHALPVQQVSTLELTHWSSVTAKPIPQRLAACSQSSVMIAVH
jgi:hypothetical protein